MKKLDRRQVLRGAVASPLLLGGSRAGGGGLPAATPQTPNLIRSENLRPGTRDWQLTRVRINAGKYRTSLIEGYCSQQSVAAGDTLSVFVSTNPARRFVLDVYRMGFYGGTGARHVQRVGPVHGEPQEVPPAGPEPGRIRECRWDPSVELAIGQDWVSGVYLGKLTTVPESSHEPYWQSYVVFIVRDNRRADVLFQCSDNTWQAYNRWPLNDSLYTHPRGGHAPDVAVSFDRPYGMYPQIFEHPLSVGSGEFLLWEYPLCFWLEQQGHDVTYGSNADGMNVEFLSRCGSVISVGHDEYWDLRQYRAAAGAMEQGCDYLWLCGNSVFIVSPLTASASGASNRILTRRGCYGPLRTDERESYSALFGGLRQAGPDERDIIGARSVVPFNGGGDWTCSNPKHWIFAGTGMSAGDSVPGLVGWEHHGEPDVGRAGLEVVAAGNVWSGGTRLGRYAATIFPGPEQNFIFNAATIFWAQGLSSPPGHILPWSHGSRPHGPDRRVRQITTNLLRRSRSRRGRAD